MVRTYVDAVDAVRQLQRDIRGLISDVEFIENGGTLRYLLDSSEVSAYVLPDEALPVALMADESPLARSISYELTTLILFGRESTTDLLGETLLLAPPYMAEIEGLAHNVIDRVRKNRDLLEKREEIEGEAKEFLKSPEHRQFTELLKRETVDAAAIERVRKFLNESDRATLLLQIVRLDNPVERLEDVLTSNRVDRLRSKYPDVDMDAATADRWYNGMSSREDENRPRDFAEREKGRDRRDRDQMARRLDSVAMGFLYGANQRYHKRERFRLITRSQAMKDVMYQREGNLDLELPYWKDIGGPPLRHPRSILAWITAKAGAGKAAGRAGALGRLKRLAASLDVFLLSDKMRDETRSADVETQFNKIRQDWRSSAELAFSITEADVRKRDATATIAKLRKVLDLSANREALSTHITEWITRFSAGVNKRLMVAGFMMGGSREMKDEAVQALTLREGREGALVLSSSLNWMPYAIEFYGEKMRDYWQTHNGIVPEVFGRFLEEWLLTEVDGTQNEALLAFAYLTASIRNWRAAEKYVDPSSSNVLDEHKHEFLFLRAVCKRKHDPTAERLHDGIKLINEAIDDKSHYVKGGDRDPRFVKEKSTLLLRLYEVGLDASAPDEELSREGIALAEEALEHRDADDYLKVQIYNNLCYHYLSRNDPFDVDELEKKLDKLVEHQRALERDQRKWSPNIRDTIAWTTWRLGTHSGQEMSISEMQQLVQEYQEIIEDSVGDEHDRRDFERRRDTIVAALNRATE